jgi:large subunit ribosomal protein L46
MNTWIVGNAPVGHRTVKARYHLEAPTVLYKPGEKIFFMKGRIMAGQVNLKGNKFGLKDWKWLTREELESCVPEGYWSSIKGMLASR